MKQHKWHKDEALKMAIKALEHYCFIESDRNEALIACKKALEPQPKEPQYLYVYEDSYYSPDDKDTRASTRIMNKRIKEWECNYIGKIKLEVEDE